jgi:hypothetical protein
MKNNHVILMYGFPRVFFAQKSTINNSMQKYDSSLLPVMKIRKCNIF